VKLSEKQHRKCKVVVNVRRMTERSDDTRGPKRQTPLTAHWRTYGWRGQNRISKVIDLQCVTKEQGQRQNKSDTLRAFSSKLSRAKPKQNNRAIDNNGIGRTLRV